MIIFFKKKLTLKKKYGFTSTQPGFDFLYIKAVALELLFILFLFAFFFLARPRAVFYPPNFILIRKKWKTSRAEFRVGNWTVPTLMYIRSPSATQHGNSRSKANKNLSNWKELHHFCILRNFSKSIENFLQMINSDAIWRPQLVEIRFCGIDCKIVIIG